MTEAPRRLAAILAADIAGYSRLMNADEKGTHERVQSHRRELIDPTIVEHHGRLIKNTGDGFLAMFDSPVEAVRCAIVIQQNMIGRNLERKKDQWIQYRIGVNLGDVIVEPEDIYGDGVNIAARLEQLAEPGSVYISGGVYEQIKYKLVVGYQSLGDRKVKNITDPVPIYRVLPDPAAVKRATRRIEWSMRAAGALVLLAVVGGIGGWYVWRPDAQEAWRGGVPSSSLPLATTTAPAPAGAPAGSSIPSAPQPSAPPPAPGAGESGAPSLEEVVPRSPPWSPPDAQQLALVAPARPEPPPRVKEPEMVAIPGGEFVMGSNDDPSEKPPHQVAVKPFFLAKFPVTVGEWRQCHAAGACAYDAPGEDALPVTNVSWLDAQNYATWLSGATQKEYRLPTEAEWEYAARGRATTKYWWGDAPTAGMASCKGCGGAFDMHRPLKVGSFRPNPFGLYDMTGLVAQWVSDCWHKDYHGAPRDGGSWDSPNCREHVLRGGSWRNDISYARSASRDQYDTSVRYPTHGFRVARSQ